MKKTVLLSLLGLAAGGASVAQADEYGRVISSTPVIQQVAVPRQVCTNQQVAVPQQKSGAGAVMGAIAGGAMGNAVGGGNGRAAATVLGLLGGALVGDRIEGSGGTQVQNVQQCSTQTFYENRAVAYNVTYEYAGKQYSVQMPHDPGPTIRLQVVPVVNAPAPAAPVTVQPVSVQPVTVQPVVAAPVVYESAVVYPAAYYYARPYYAPAGVSLNVGYTYYGGHYHHRPGYYWR